MSAPDYEDEADDRIAEAQQRVAELERLVERATVKSESFVPSDPGALSGVRRRPSRRADARRLAAYSREARLWVELAGARRALSILEQARDAAEAYSRSTVDLSALRSARFVRTRHGWHRVVRVNAKSVTVATPHSWTERIALDAVLEITT